MRTLTYQEVRRAALPAKVELLHVTYEYHPLEDRVVVRIRSHLQTAAAKTYRIPREGWRHEKPCRCAFCAEEPAA